MGDLRDQEIAMWGQEPDEYEPKKKAGRKPLPANEKKRQVNFYLTHDEEAKMRQCLAEIRQLIQEKIDKENTK